MWCAFLHLHGRLQLLDNLRMRNTSLPEVSVIVPVYNSERYIQETLESAVRQFSDISKLEVIAIDDGSTDSSLSIMRNLASLHPNLRVFTQPNSGGPSRPRNIGIENANGKFIFFLDADDVLADGALNEISTFANRHDSDVVLSKFGSINGRHVPLQMFKKSIPNADIVKDLAWDSLGPVKLFRSELIQANNLRFPEDQWIGEDQAFTATMYLTARKVSILAEREYILIRKRDDGKNITSRQQTLNDKYLTCVRLGSTIEKYVPSGRLRDRLVRRIFTSTLTGAVGATLINSNEVERSNFVASVRKNLLPMYTAGVQDYCNHLLQIKYYCLLHGTDAQIIAASKLKQPNFNDKYFLNSAGALELDFKDTCLNEIPVQIRRNYTFSAFHTELTKLNTSSSSITIEGAVSCAGLALAPELEAVLLINRDTGEEFLLSDSLVAVTSQASINFTLCIDTTEVTVLEGISDGAWGVFVDLRLGASRKRIRFGKRPQSIPNNRHNLTLAHKSKDVVIYFNKGYENLTFDIGGSVHKKEPHFKVRSARSEKINNVEHIIFSINKREQSSSLRITNFAGFDEPLCRTISDKEIEIAIPLVSQEILQVEPNIEMNGVSFWIDLSSVKMRNRTHLQMGFDAKNSIVQIRRSWDSSTRPDKDPSNFNVFGTDTEPLNMYWWEGRPNFGDVIGPWLGELVTGRPVINVKGKGHIGRGIISVGSLLNHIDAPGHSVWGTGLIEPLTKADVRRLISREPATIAAVRGVKTRGELIGKLGWDVPEIYGDPALLLPKFYTPSSMSLPNEIAFCPHYAHLEGVPTNHDHGYNFVDISHTPSSVIDTIANSRICISSSLNGIIIAQAYGVPWVWLRAADNALVGDKFKFFDFFSGIGIDEIESHDVALKDFKNLDIKSIARHSKLPKSNFDSEKLLNSFPFNFDNR